MSTPPYLAVHPHDVPGDGLVCGGVALVEDDEEEVEAGHDGRGDGHVRLERLAPVVTVRICWELVGSV